MTVAGVVGAGPSSPGEMTAPGVVLFTPSYALGAVGQPAGDDQLLLVEGTMATGEAAR